MYDRNQVEEWIDYLSEVDPSKSYDSQCNCYSCQLIRDGFNVWRNRTRRAKIVCNHGATYGQCVEEKCSHYWCRG